jgi:hypothetical protein
LKNSKNILGRVWKIVLPHISQQNKTKISAVAEIIRHPIHHAKDVKLQMELNPMKVKAYRLVGYETGC